MPDLLRSITVRHRVWGEHRWPDAPPHRAYLAMPHRHLFVFELTVRVNHDDREVEFHDLLDWLRDAATYDRGYMATLSCEQLAEQLLVDAAARWPGRALEAKVSEDGECWATVSRP